MVVDVLVDLARDRVRRFVQRQRFLVAGDGAHQEGRGEREEVVEPEKERYAKRAEAEEREENVPREAGLPASRLHDDWRGKVRVCAPGRGEVGNEKRLTGGVRRVEYSTVSMK